MGLPPTYDVLHLDACVEQLARAMCAEDEDHIHSEGRRIGLSSDKDSVVPSETCCCNGTWLSSIAR